ncbi:IscS subfamily cysteine desulfurase [Alteribacillus iranensis]|uniref:Cysteine desulfurase n=1 Tax=Alteribacillus iranensis TaxID=930128 RepID=A0A1I2BMX0_9BACI|nr:IscS subfamily cysteine desulfurase [Alteribacillus iranensis]SFE57501.1 cysteine desulfurase [Alteribacillus iranensis]
MIYLDHCATTPMSSEAIDAYRKAALSYYGNEQSLHDMGEEANQLLRHCKREIANLIHADPKGIYFTSGGSDSNISTLLSLAYGNQKRGRHIITSPFEHPSVYQAMNKLRQEGFIIEEVRALPNGQVDLTSLQQLLRKDTILVSICHASSETGVIQPLDEIGHLLGAEVVFHSDMVQTFAKLHIDIKQLHVDAASFSSHKVYGPKNTGACYISPKVTWRGIYEGVTHQEGFRPGTVDVPGITAFATAAATLYEELPSLSETWRRMQQWLLDILEPLGFHLFGDRDTRLPHHLALRASGYEGQWMMLEANRNGIAFSSGSACKTSHSAPPKSLLAMGHSPDEAHGLFRISFGTGTTWEEIEETAHVLQKIVHS